jgi:hypothetical protein
MPALFNTVDSTKFYNFISNKFPHGVYISELSSISPTFLIRDWFTTYALPTSSLFASNRISYYFPSVVSSPTENESCTGTANGSTNFRFSIGMGTDYTITNNSPASTITLNTQNSGSSSVLVASLTNSAHITASSILSENRHFTFGVCSPTSVVLVTFELKDNPEKNLTTFDSVAIYSAGWLQEGIFPSPFTTATHRYNNCYTFTHRYSSGLIPSFSSGRMPSTTGTTTSIECKDAKYFDINCLSGAYTTGLFLTDLLLHESGTPFHLRGKVDNRVLCIGRGTFEVGKIYRATNVFGRTGNEDWLCIIPFMGSTATYTTVNWVKGQSHLRSQAWQPNQLDYILMRIYTEED